MFWSKIWFFLVAVAAAVALSVAVTMPRPQERAQRDEIDERVSRARSSTEMLLRENARKWVDLAASFARVPAPPGQPKLKLDGNLDQASRETRDISAELHQTTLETLRYILSQVSGTQKPEFAMALDKWGRVVARVGLNEREWGEDLSTYFVVRDALHGYLRDDLWLIDGKLYRVAASPVIDRQSSDYVGAVVLGDEVDNVLARELEKRIGRCAPGNEGAESCDPKVAFFVQGRQIVTPAPELTDDIYKEYRARKDRLFSKDEKERASALAPFVLKTANREYVVALKQLPGEAGAQEGFYAVFTTRPTPVGVLGRIGPALGEATPRDWMVVGGGFLLALIAGIVFMWLESDRPLKRLVLDAVSLGKGEVPKLDEERHKGKFGSIARSVNIALEKQQREQKAAKKDLGAVLGPPPEDGIFSGARPLPSSGPGAISGAPFAPPPPSDFSFEPPPPAPAPSRAPMRLGPEPISAGPVGAVEAGGFDFDMPPPPPPAAPPPPPVAARSPAPRPATPPPPPPPDLPSMPPVGGPRAARPAPPPVPPSVTPPPSPLPVRPKTPIPSARGAAATPPPVLPNLDDDLLAPNMDDDILAAAAAQPAMAPASAFRGGGDFGGATLVADPSEELLRQAAEDTEEAYFREVYGEFVDLKRKCGENVDGLTFEKFAQKLRQNREQLVAKYSCRSVKFQVYVKDGKAALKATPVKS